MNRVDQLMEISLSRQRYWLIPSLAAGLLALVTYGVLPELGAKRIAMLMDPINLSLLVFLALAGIGYLIYYRYVMKEPRWLVLFLLAGWALTNGMNEKMLEFGINLHFRPLIMLVFGIPTLVLIIANRQLLWKHFLHFRLYAAFLLWLSFYFIFFNAHASDPRLYEEGSFFEGSVGILQAVSYTYNFLALCVAAIAVHRSSHPLEYFDWLNKGVLIVSIGVALYTIAGYPFMLTSQWLDGFIRAHGIFGHPNPFSHHTGLLLLYILGLYFYYQDDNQKRLPKFLLVTALFTNLCAFLLGLSKTAIGVVSISVSIIFLLNLSAPKIRKNVLTGAICLAVLIPLGLWLYSGVAGESFQTIVQRRLDNTYSLDWRLQVWEYLLSGIQGFALLTGHGFTSANVWVYQLLYNSETNTKPLMMVHNGYIGLLYDLGIMGLLYFVAVLSVFFKASQQIFKTDCRQTRPLFSLTIALCVYFLVICAFDEATYMFDAPILFWTFITTLDSLTFYEKGLEQRKLQEERTHASG